jgi:hypothetical protein
MKRSDALAHIFLTAALGLAALAAEHVSKKHRRRDVADSEQLPLSLWEKAMAAQMAGEMQLGPDGETLRYDQNDQHWYVGLKAGDELVEQKLDIRDPFNAEEAVHQAMDIFYANEPKVQPENTPAGERTFITTHPSRNAWRLWVPCQECGGHYLDLPVEKEDSQQWNARVIAGTYLRNQNGCLNCQAKTIREHHGLPGEKTSAWFDTLTGEWLLWQPISEDFGTNVSLGLPHFFYSPEEVEKAAHQLLAQTKHDV